MFSLHVPGFPPHTLFLSFLNVFLKLRLYLLITAVANPLVVKYMYKKMDSHSNVSFKLSWLSVRLHLGLGSFAINLPIAVQLSRLPMRTSVYSHCLCLEFFSAAYVCFHANNSSATSTPNMKTCIFF